ncbi:MAG: hypothetical protein FWG13_00450 [Leptospirales bacterium]|nr:hypothetical protein [Leptospirales bacterium]
MFDTADVYDELVIKYSSNILLEENMKIFRAAAALLFVLSAAVQTFALDVTVTPPQISGAPALGGTNLENRIMEQLSGINDKPKKFTKANANAASYANHTATQRGYTDYEYFALTVGAMAGAQVSTFSSDDFTGLGSSIKEEGDAKIGLSAQFAAQLGIKAWFISDDLYLGVRAGYFKFNFDANDDNKFKYKTFMIGLVGNYVLFNKTTIGSGAVKLRGLNFGTGIIFQSSDTKYMMKVKDIAPQPTGDPGIDLTVDPYLKYSMDSKIVTIPLEFTTALRLLYCVNFTLGFGADLVMGRTDVTLDMDGDIKVTGPDADDATIDKPGRFKVVGGTKSYPNIIMPKFTAGIGIGIGDALIIDVPFTLYLGYGFDVGITIGTVW